jgi:uncharacterized protein involved in exopolysaccharide biosynthesis
MSGELRLTPILESVIQRWYIVAAVGIIGGVVGLLFTLSQPPVYDASAILTVGLNFDLTAPLSQYDEDLALSKVASVVVAEPVWSQALLDTGIQPAPNSAIPGGSESRLGHWLARKGSRWEFTVSSHDPELSARVANAWALVGEAALSEALIHALQAKSTQLQLNEVLAELGQVQADGSSQSDQIERLENIVDEFQTRLQVELEAAHGVASFVSFDLTEQANSPDESATRGRGQTVLAGTILGFLLGIVLAIIVGSGKGQEPSS